MKVSLRIPDPPLRRALKDLLRGDGHEVASFEGPTTEPALRISGDDPGAPPPAGWAVLVLRRSPVADGQVACPGPALEEALATQGLATWHPPLDAHLLLQVLAGTAGAASRVPVERAPDLAGSPHAWLRIDPRAGLVVGASAQAAELLDLKPDGLPQALGAVALPGGLRDALRDQSEGLRSEEHLDGGRLCSWWTDPSGQRVACLLQAPIHRDAREARNQQSLARLGQMAATLAHEIRNPVASVAGALDLLEGESDPTEQAEILSMARARLRQMSHLLEQTLHLARPIEGPPERLVVQDVIRSAVSVARLDPQFADTQIEIVLPDAPVEVRAYVQPLVQALINLLLNAAQAQEGKGVIRLALDRDGRRAFLRVQDEGPGIPPEKREEIFKPFYTTKSSGTGLGLPEVRRAMEAAGGAVTVEDVEDGACLCLELPLAEGE